MNAAGRESVLLLVVSEGFKTGSNESKSEGNFFLSHHVKAKITLELKEH